MKKINLIIILCSLIFLGSVCNRENEDCHRTITFINNSDKDLYVIWSSGYPDTLYFKVEFPNPAQGSESLFKVLSGEKSTAALGYRGCWELKFEDLKSSILMIYVFDAQVLETTPWDTVNANYLVKKRYDLTLDDIQGMDWTITYP